ncbi:beta-phosphoglucomutase [Halalkalibacter akibai]|uniref:Beta-phosphoglucomutase n=1 Tax=Halalkalibacter akibai (strain ATCC 43226 / DSM 21942 / CIP 109018 / JCM 9157 / 1139) TaxID=1236973 RepID=W4R100_HALA3|nr:beta-phosphoglucomutase [Halalkalibacter akibai]GAE37573.1 beta-phosphoglucomutase [Halalkalibacter akibai JCM 9157]
MKQMKAVIFDMDGVISNTVPIQYETNLRLAKTLNISFSREWNQSLQGLSRRKTVEAMIEASSSTFTEDEVDEICNKKNYHYRELISQLTPRDAQPGIREFIQELANHKIPMVIASASQNASFVLSKLELLSFFQGVVDVTTLKRGKPDPEIFLKAADIVGVAPAECIALEDGEAGLTAILQTEMFSVGIGIEPFMKNADYYVESTSKLTLDGLEAVLNKHQRTIR